MTQPSRRFFIEQAVLSAAVNRSEIRRAHEIGFVNGQFMRAILDEYRKLRAAWEQGGIRI